MTIRHEPIEPSTNFAPLSIGACATLACTWEATAAKPGNVYRGADFDDVTYADFLTSAAVCGPIIQRASLDGVGATVLAAVSATQRVVATNTNLGTLLLLAPLAAVPRDQRLADGIGPLLDELDTHDTRLVYQAIRAAGAGGLGQTDTADVHVPTPPDGRLVDAMQLAAGRDLVARQYANGFNEVLECSAEWIAAGVAGGWSLAEAIVHAHVRLMATFPDSLIARKCGPAIAQQAADRATAVLALGEPDAADYEAGMADLDFWLRTDGHRRNPGTTADLVAAGLFVLLREGRIDWPVSFYARRND
jgi:triphosphoribosyl-dephospho-CoA synthase